MKKRILTMTLAAVLGTTLLCGCTMGHTADTNQAQESVEEPTPTPTEAPTPTATPMPTEAPTPTPEPQEPIPDGMAKSSLTGEYVPPETENNRPYSFMIDNVQAAVPQSGIGSAKIYYEAPVEGQYTRINAVFEDVSDQQRIGPLRSCRDYFLSLTAGLDPLFVHYGQAAYALPYLESDYVDNISGLLGSTYGCFYRDYTYHSGEHTAYIGAEGLAKAVDIRSYETTHKDDYSPMYKFAWVGDTVDNNGGEEASYVATGYPYNAPWFEYHADEGLYYRYQFGGAHVDVETGEQLKVKNIILEYENYDIYQRTTIDHPVYLHFDTTAGGKGKYITNGKAVDITWERKSFWEPVKYFDADGNELVLNTGKTWVCLIQNEYLGNCVMGADSTSAACVESAEDVAEAVQYNADWKAAYEHGEDLYLTIMNQERERAIASHGGKSKVEEGTVKNS